MKSAKILFLIALTLAALSAGVWAQTSASTTPATNKNNQPEAATPAQPAVTAADLQALKDALAAQQKQIQALQDELHRKDQVAQQAQTTAAGAAAKADAPQLQASQQLKAVSQLNNNVAGLKAVNENVRRQPNFEERGLVPPGLATDGRSRYAADLRQADGGPDHHSFQRHQHYSRWIRGSGLRAALESARRRLAYAL